MLDASVWHPILAEQKRGRDGSDATAAAIAGSHCYHHFVSSWMTHDKGKHSQTEAQRNPTATARHGGGGPVPTGQGLRSSNPWKSYDVATKATDAASLPKAPADDMSAAAKGKPDDTTPPAAKLPKKAPLHDKPALHEFARRAAAKKKAARRKAYASHHGPG